jgi:hypothetical protein
VTFDGCVFVGNHYPNGVPGVGLRQLGLITMRSSAGGILNVTNSLFVHNEFVVTESNVRKSEKEKTRQSCLLPDDGWIHSNVPSPHVFLFCFVVVVVVVVVYTHTQAVRYLLDQRIGRQCTESVQQLFLFQYTTGWGIGLFGKYE